MTRTPLCSKWTIADEMLKQIQDAYDADLEESLAAMKQARQLQEQGTARATDTNVMLEEGLAEIAHARAALSALRGKLRGGTDLGPLS